MTKVYIGGIPVDSKEHEIEDEFKKFGRLESVWLARNPPGFAFVTYEDARDADDAIRSMDGKSFLGKRIRVEKSKERRGGGRTDRYRSRSRSRSRGRRSRPRPSGTNHPSYRRGEYRVRISNLSSRTSWRELKDFLRSGGDICYADARNGEGVADFLTYEDMDRAIRKLDGTTLQGREVRIEELRRSRSRSRRKSNSRSRSRSRSRKRYRR